MSDIFTSTLNTRRLLPDSYRYIRSDAPLNLTEKEIRFLIEKNITVIVDLRTEEEIYKKPCSLQKNPAFRYVNLSVTGGNTIPESPDYVSESYYNMVDNQMTKIISFIENAEENVMFFCSAGKDRTGVVSALLLKRLDFPDEYIINDYMLSAVNLYDILSKYAVSNNIDIDIILPQKRYMEEFLRKIS